MMDTGGFAYASKKSNFSLYLTAAANIFCA